MAQQMSFLPETETPEVELPDHQYVEGFLSPEEEAECIRRIDANEGEWLTDISRRVQHYGWRYDYTARSVTSEMRIGALPDWLQALAERLYETGLFERPPDQVIVNEYLPGQGIAMHTDHPGFGPTVAMVSLGDVWEMDFVRGDNAPETRTSMALARGSALILSGEARASWRHGIAKRKSDHGRPRKRRLSLTFRTVRRDAEE